MQNEVVSDLVHFRPFQKDTDLNFVLSTWVLCFYDRNFFFRPWSEDSYFKSYTPFLKNFILSLPAEYILMACLKEDIDVLLGYSIVEPIDEELLLHWIYVKQVWRNISIAKHLLQQQNASSLFPQIKEFRKQLKLRRKSLKRLKGMNHEYTGRGQNSSRSTGRIETPLEAGGASAIPL